MLPTSKVGNTNTLALPAISLSGAFLAATLATKAASDCNSPSIFTSGAISLAKRVASTITCGSLAMARARAQFSCNFFACAGIRVIDNTFFKSLEDGVKAALESKAEIVVVCSSDDDYAEVAPKIKEMLGDKAILVVAGAPACMEELQSKGINNFISVKSNVLETLKGYLKQMGI